MNYQALLFCPDEKTARVVTQVLTELEFSVELCNEPFAMVKKLMAKQYDAVVVDCDNEQNATLLFKSARNSTSNQASLAVAVVEGQAGVAKAFRIGANLVLTKPVNVEQSKGTLRVARGLLRKAEGGKAAAAKPIAPPMAGMPKPMTTGFPPASGQGLSSAKVAASTSAAKFAATTSGNPPVLRTDTSNTSFEIDQDPTPALEATEVAFLQSIPQVGPSKTSAHATTPQISKESPWLQLTRPTDQTKAPIKGNDVEVPLAQSDVTETAAPVATPVRVRHPFNTGLSSAQGAAAAAPAREVVLPPQGKEQKKPGEKTSETSQQSSRRSETSSGIKSPHEEASQDAPAFAAATPETNRSRTPLIAALVVIAIAWAGYFGWNKLQMAPKPSVVQYTPAVPQTEAPAPVPTESAPADAPAAGTQQQVQQPVPQLNQNQSRDSHQGAKPTADEVVVIENATPDSAPEAKPLPVKKNPRSEVKTSSAVIQQPVAPPQLQLGSSATDQTIAGLITTTSVPVLKRSPEILRISQGITQGMLVKKVNPVYPRQALTLHREGTVQILANIAKTGSISSAKVIKGDPVLGQAALAAVKQWKYQPYTLDGQAVDVQTQISVNFKLP